MCNAYTLENSFRVYTKKNKRKKEFGNLKLFEGKKLF